MVTRGLTAEGRPDEFGLPTAPANRFVSAGRLTVAHEGVCEYELIDVEDDAAHTLALTVLRSTGMLSRLGMAYRPFPAGPLTPVEGLQMRGKQVELRYALALDCDDPYRLADDVLLPLEPVAAWAAARARPRAASWRSTAPRSARCTASPACSRSASSTRPRSRPWSRFPGAPAGSSTCAATRRPPSRGPSSYAPSASPPPGCATV